MTPIERVEKALADGTFPAEWTVDVQYLVDLNDMDGRVLKSEGRLALEGAKHLVLERQIEAQRLALLEARAYLHRQTSVGVDGSDAWFVEKRVNDALAGVR